MYSVNLDIRKNISQILPAMFRHRHDRNYLIIKIRCVKNLVVERKSVEAEKTVLVINHLFNAPCVISRFRAKSFWQNKKI